LLTLGMYGSAFFAIVWSSVLTCAPFNLGSYSSYGETVTGPQFLRQAGIPIGALTVIFAVIAYGLARERSWTRPVMIGFWVIFDAVMIAAVIKDPSADIGVAVAVFFALIYIGAAGWYLFGKESVVDYYNALEAEEAARDAAVTASSSRR
jgi:hypothetical protein